MSKSNNSQTVITEAQLKKFTVFSEFGDNRSKHLSTEDNVLIFSGTLLKDKEHTKENLERAKIEAIATLLVSSIAKRFLSAHISYAAVENCDFNILYVNEKGEKATLLDLALRTKQYNEDIVETLLMNGLKPDLIDSDFNPLIFIINDTTPSSLTHDKEQNYQLLRMLLENKCPVNKTHAAKIDNRLNSPLHLAIYQNDLQMVNLLLEHGADVNQVNANGDTALHLACQPSSTINPEIIISLLNHGAAIGKFNNQKKNIGEFSYQLDSMGSLGGAYTKAATMIVDYIDQYNQVKDLMKLNEPAKIIAVIETIKTTYPINAQMMIQSVMNSEYTFNHRTGTIAEVLSEPKFSGIKAKILAEMGITSEPIKTGDKKYSSSTLQLPKTEKKVNVDKLESKLKETKKEGSAQQFLSLKDASEKSTDVNQARYEAALISIGKLLANNQNITLQDIEDTASRSFSQFLSDAARDGVLVEHFIQSAETHKVDLNKIYTDGDGIKYTLIDYALKYEQMNDSGIKLLLSKGVKLGLADYNPLILAIKNDDDDLVKELLSLKCPVNKPHSSRVDGSFNSPLHTAILNNDEDMVNLLLSYGADVNQPNAAGDTPFNMACNNTTPNMEIISSLVNYGAAISKANKDGKIHSNPKSNHALSATRIYGSKESELIGKLEICYEYHQQIQKMVSTGKYENIIPTLQGITGADSQSMIASVINSEFTKGGKVFNGLADLASKEKNTKLMTNLLAFGARTNIPGQLTQEGKNNEFKFGQTIGEKSTQKDQKNQRRLSITQLSGTEHRKEITHLISKSEQQVKHEVADALPQDAIVTKLMKELRQQYQFNELKEKKIEETPSKQLPTDSYKTPQKKPAKRKRPEAVTGQEKKQHIEGKEKKQNTEHNDIDGEPFAGEPFATPLALNFQTPQKDSRG